MNQQSLPLLLPATHQLVTRLETFLLQQPMRDVEEFVGWLRSAREFAESARARQLHAQQSSEQGGE